MLNFNLESGWKEQLCDQVIMNFISNGDTFAKLLKLLKGIKFKSTQISIHKPFKMTFRYYPKGAANTKKIPSE